VYDGHGGDECASYVASQLHVKIARQALKHSLDMRKAIEEGYNETQMLWREALGRNGLSTIVGSTSVTALIHGTTMHVAWAGDSSAILFLKSGIWLDFVIPHKPIFDVCIIVCLMG
jgi:serine/threonine protein phosphatase PrpC